jgi:hypothetical protein
MSRWIGVTLIGAGAALMTFGLADYNASSPAPPSAGSVVVSMSAAAWNILYSPSMPAHPTAATGGGWYFEFPGCGGAPTCSVHYVTVPVNVAASTNVKAKFEITTTGRPGFHYKLKPDNTCVAPAHVRLFVQRKGDDLTAGKEYWRWWSDPVAFQLAPRAAELTAALMPEQWVSVFGKRGDFDASSKAGFRQAIQQIGNVGFTFGGGCFFGHGVNVIDGTARFNATEYSIK